MQISPLFHSVIEIQICLFFQSQILAVLIPNKTRGGLQQKFYVVGTETVNKALFFLT